MMKAYEFGHRYAHIYEMLGYAVATKELGVDADDILVSIDDTEYEFYNQGDKLLYSIIDENGVPSPGAPVVELFK